MKNNKIKNNYNNLKEAWKDPRKKAGIKLLSYFIFFFVFLLIASITSRLSNDRPRNTGTTTTTTTTKQVDKYNDKQKELLTNKFNISYVINIDNIEYKINGKLDNSIVSGYLETPSGIKKIIIKDDNVYEINNNQEVVLESDINANFINISYIINLIKQNSAIINDTNTIKTYTYDIKDINSKIIVSSSETSITEIKIENEVSTYILSFDK